MELQLRAVGLDELAKGVLVACAGPAEHVFAHLTCHDTIFGRSESDGIGVSTEMTKTATTGARLTTLVLAAAAWIVALRQMTGMDMGVATELGSFASFVGYWVPMMTAMMLPGAAPAAFRLARVQTAPLFVGSYLAVWTLLGVAVYALYRPHGSVVAGALTVGAGLYEFTPLKRDCRRRCRESIRSGLEFGVYCVGSSIGLMVMLVALGVMSITWMSLVAVLVLAQKLLPNRPAVDVPVAAAIVALGIGVATGS
jgi:predicted metal-binding membrane protein